MSYTLETNTESSKIIHLNSRDADKNYSNNTSYCLFTLDTPIEIDDNHAALVSLNSAIVPYSMYNIRQGINTKIPYRTVGGTTGYVELDIGNYTISTLATEIRTKLNSGPYTGAPLAQTYVVAFDRKTMKYKFSCGTAECHFDFSLQNDTAHIELGFPVLGTSSNINSTPIFSPNVPDVNGSVHSLFIRTNLTSKSSIDSHTKSFSTILAKIPIDVNFGGVLFMNPRDNLHKVLLDIKQINQVVVRLTDEQNRLFDLNGLEFNLSIMIDIVNKKEKLQLDKRRIKEDYQIEQQILKDKEDENKKSKETRGRPRKPGRPKKVETKVNN